MHINGNVNKVTYWVGRKIKGIKVKKIGRKGKKSGFQEGKGLWKVRWGTLGKYGKGDLEKVGRQTKGVNGRVKRKRQ